MILMEKLPTQQYVLGENFSFEEYLDLVAENRDSIYWFSPAVEGIIIAVYILVIIFGLISNGLVCFVICHKKNLHTATNMLIMNLALSDIIMCIFCTPLTVVKLLLKNWMLGELMCKLTPWLQGITVFASTLSITAIAMERYYMIVKPSCGGKHTKKVLTAMLMIAIWILSGIICFPLMIYSKVEVIEYISIVKFTMCFEKWPPYMSRFAYASCIMLIQFIIPIAVLLIAHWKICNFLKFRITRDPKSRYELSRAMKDAKRHRKNTTLLMAIAIMFALCWFPLTLLNLLADFDYNIFISKNFILSFTIAHLIAMMSACLNPIMYGWFNSNFRHEFSEFVFFCKSNDVNIDLEPPEEQIVVYKRQMSYKAIQTEIQPVVPSKVVHHVQSKDTQPLNFNSQSASFPQNHDFSLDDDSE